jgi:hypothetical protein
MQRVIVTFTAFANLPVNQILMGIILLQQLGYWR